MAYNPSSRTTILPLPLYLVVAALLWVSSCTSKDTAQVAPVDEYNPTPVTIKSGVRGIADPVIPADNPTTKEGIELGRFLFYDPKLSADGTISCASCHKLDKGMADDQVKSIGIRGQRTLRNSMAIVNLAWVNRFFWDGRSRTLEEQSLHPIQDPLEMANTLPQMVATLQAEAMYPPLFYKAFGTRTITSDLVAKALAQFERSIVSFNSRYDRYLNGLDSALTNTEIEGLALFATHPDPFSGRNGIRGANCGDCHSVGLFQGRTNGFQGFLNNGVQPQISDLGLMNVTQDANDMGKMRVVSLRNIALTAPYMHDGSIPTLEAVMDHYNSPDLFSRPKVDFLITEAVNQRFGTSLGLTAAEKAKVVAFMRALTDTSFVNNPAFKNPLGSR